MFFDLLNGILTLAAIALERKTDNLKGSAPVPYKGYDICLNKKGKKEKE